MFGKKKSPAASAGEADALIGFIEVDAGMVWIGDPCYVMGDDAPNRVTDWQDFVKASFEPGGHAPLGDGVGVVAPSGYGDGRYPVYATHRDGRIAELRVVFIDDEEAGD